MQQVCDYGSRTIDYSNRKTINKDSRSKEDFKRKRDHSSEERKEVTKRNEKCDKFGGKEAKILKDFQPQNRKQQNQKQANNNKQKSSRRSQYQTIDLRDTKEHYSSKSKGRSRQWNDQATKKTHSKTQLLINEAKSKVYDPLVYIYKTMTESDRSKLNEKWRKGLEHQLVIFEKIQNQLKQSCELAQTRTSNAHKKGPDTETEWNDPPLRDSSRQLIGANNSYILLGNSLRDKYFKVVTNRHAMQSYLP